MNGNKTTSGANPAGRWDGFSSADLVLVDSAPLIYFLDDHPEFAPRFSGLFELHEQDRVRIAISVIAVSEVLAGPFKRGLDAVAKRYEKSLSNFDIVPVSIEIAIMAARLRTAAGLRLPDALVAATALEIGATSLVTHDRDFSRLKQGLRILNGGAESITQASQ